MRNAVRLAVMLPFFGMIAGIGWGAAAAGDIKRARGFGSFSAPAAVLAPAGHRPLPPPDPVAEAHGYAIAASMGASSPGKCNAIGLEFRRGCLDYVARRRAGATDERLLIPSSDRRQPPL